MSIQFDDTYNVSQEYKEFVEKFQPRKTTDDCYTPQNIYRAVMEWATREYRLQGRPIVRPFYPGGDYEREPYPPGCIVLDNPPFSILSKICQFYDENCVDYFLFAPALTLFSTNSGKSNYILCDACITYENGANVKTGFVTNLGTDRVILSATLHDLLRRENEKNIKKNIAELPRYVYPDHLITAATLEKIVCRGIELRIPRESCVFIRAMDAQRKTGKAVYGGAFLLSERAAAERAAAERAAAERAAAKRWELSDREISIIKHLQ